jgi:hypothetical protein
MIIVRFDVSGVMPVSGLLVLRGSRTSIDHIFRNTLPFSFSHNIIYAQIIIIIIISYYNKIVYYLYFYIV